MSSRPAPTVSVLIPMYNAREFVHEAWESVLRQRYTDWELLIVDDGSTDGSDELARALARQDSDRVTYLEHPGRHNHGVSATRNLAIRHARGCYIAILDHDDVWHPEKLVLQVEAIRRHPEVGLVYGEMETINTRREILEGERFGRGVPNMPFNYAERLLRGNVIPASTVLLRRRCLDHSMPFEEGLRYQFEDWALWARLALRGVAFLFIPQTLAYYRVHPQSFSAKLDPLSAARATVEWLHCVFRSEGQPVSRRRDTHLWWAAQILWDAHRCAEQGNAYRAAAMLGLCATLDPRICGRRRYWAGWLKVVLGKRGNLAAGRVRAALARAARG